MPEMRIDFGLGPGRYADRHELPTKGRIAFYDYLVENPGAFKARYDVLKGPWRHAEHDSYSPSGEIALARFSGRVDNHRSE